MAKTGLLFGSFNPVHVGHLIIAEYFASQGYCDSVQLVVSPRNPLKDSMDLAPESHRLAMVRLAVRGNPALKANAIEFSLPRPSYTYDTLCALRNRNSGHQYALIIGSDNFDTFRQWKDFRNILDEFHILAYRRPGFAGSPFESHPHVQMIEDAPQISLSASYIRACIHANKSIRYLVPDGVRRYLEREGLYR